MYSYLEKKSRSWTELIRTLWSGNSTWKKRFYVLTNLGMLVYEDQSMKKPLKLHNTLEMRTEKVSDKTYSKKYVFKLVGIDEDEIVFAA